MLLSSEGNGIVELGCVFVVGVVGQYGVELRCLEACHLCIPPPEAPVRSVPGCRDTKESGGGLGGGTCAGMTLRPRSRIRASEPPWLSAGRMKGDSGRVGVRTYWLNFSMSAPVVPYVEVYCEEVEACPAPVKGRGRRRNSRKREFLCGLLKVEAVYRVVDVFRG